MTLTAINPTSALSLPMLSAASAAPTLTSMSLGQANPGAVPDPKSDQRIHAAAREFEAMLVRQMLTAAGMGGTGKDGVYGGMEVDALAKAVTQGHGLGLAQQIADALAREAHGHKRG